MSLPAERWTENRAGGGGLLQLREVWVARELIWFFALRDFQVRYKQAVVGVAWVVVQPVVTVVAFTVAFQHIARVETSGIPYPVFALAALLGWTYISQCVSRGSEVLVTNPALVSKVYFPRLVAPLSATLPSLVDLGVGLVLLAVLSVVYGVIPTPALLLLPVWLLLLVLTALGPVLLLAALNVRYRDVRYVVPPLLQALLFLSPVAYSGVGLQGTSRLLYALNPAVGPLEFGRFVLVGGPWPGWQLALSVGVALVIALIGLVYFQSAQRAFADYI
ncbi:MAG TPA: ABC transporter permease [Propionibacteriaceae bacterium]|nr:ABC transporter permease [Propionibacteriaceae bacterium]